MASDSSEIAIGDAEFAGVENAGVTLNGEMAHICALSYRTRQLPGRIA